MFAIIARINGWIDSRSAFETILECVGCAVLIPLVAFVLRIIFVAPAELVKESAESKKSEEINPNSVFPAVIAILLATCSFLAVGFAFSLKFNYSKIADRQNTTQTAKEEQPKPLPAKIIPAPAQSPVPFNITVTPPPPGLSPDDEITIQDITKVFREASLDDPSSLIAIRNFQNGATNETVKEFAARDAKLLLGKIEDKAAKKMAEIKSAENSTNDNDFRVLVAYNLHKSLYANPSFPQNNFPFQVDFKSEKTNEIVAYCLERSKDPSEQSRFYATAPAYTWFLAIREEAGVNFEMFDFKAVEDWLTNHPSVASNVPVKK